VQVAESKTTTPPMNRALAIAAAAIATAVAHTQSSTSFCQPSQPCWPSDDAWKQLNASVDGRLLVVLPEGMLCADPSSPACQSLQANWTNPWWRADQPGAMQVPSLECSDDAQCCLVAGQPCSQGNVPPVGIAATTTAHVAAAFAFAAKVSGARRRPRVAASGGRDSCECRIRVPCGL
jgi:hypothetical protein